MIYVKNKTFITLYSLMLTYRLNAKSNLDLNSSTV